MEDRGMKKFHLWKFCFKEERKLLIKYVKQIINYEMCFFFVHFA